MSQIVSIQLVGDDHVIVVEHDGVSRALRYPADQAIDVSCREACALVESEAAVPGGTPVDVPKAFRSDVVRLTPTPAVEPVRVKG